MRVPDPAASRLSTVLSAALYLMTSYRRSGCPRVALMIARHLECLAAHPEADPVMRSVCIGLSEDWNQASRCVDEPSQARH
jgi:hypothetical protein